MKAKSHCGMCKADHELEMTPVEYKTLLVAVKNAFTSSGRLLIACDGCMPFQLTGQSKKEAV